MHILLLEDNQIDTITFERALLKTNKEYDLMVKENGEEGMAYLMNIENSPDLIVLDLNMPNMGGIEFLTVIKKSERFGSIPTLILTTSDHNKDKVETFRLGAAGYFVKPLSLKDYENMLMTITNYWSESKRPK